MPILLFVLFSIASISGQVRIGDVPIPGATVTAIHGETRIVTITNQQGEYSFPDSVDGMWSIQVEKLGFTTVNGDASTTNWELKILPLKEIHAVPVHYEKPDITNAQDPTETQTGFARMEVDASNGIESQQPKAADSPSTSGTFDNLSDEELNQRAMGGSLINGTVNNGAETPFAQSPAFGNNRFFNQRLYTGNVGVIIGSSVFDAQPYSLIGQNMPKPAYSNYQASFSLGGLLKIPHIFKNGPYFFLHYEHKQNRNANSIWGRMPTVAERNGNFSQSVDALGQPVQLRDPKSGLLIDGNILSAERISAQARSLLDLFPLSNIDDNERYNYQAAILDDINQDNVLLRLNKSLSWKNQFFGGFDYLRERSDDLDLFKFVDVKRNSNIAIDLNWQTRLTPKFLSQFRYQFSRQALYVTPYFANLVNISGNAGIIGNNQESINWGPPTLQFASGIASLSDVQYARNRIQNSGFSHTNSWFNMHHKFTFGAGMQWNQLNLLSQKDARGIFKFTGEVTGYDFADFLIGIPQTSSIAFGNADKYFRQKLYHAFLTDDWRVSPGLTLNAGVRFEYETPMNELRGRLVNLNIASDFSEATPIVGNGLIHPDKSGIQPRIGFAWRPGSASLILRGGYGIYRNTNVYQSIALQMAQQAPLSKSLIAQYTPENFLTLENAFTTAQQVTSNTFAVDPNLHIGTVQSWQLSIQHSLPVALQVTLTYMGTKGAHLLQEFLPNTFPSGALKPSGYAYLSSNGNSIRHAGVMQLRRRLRSGLAADFQYTYSKSLDDAPLMAGGHVVTASEGGTEIAQNWLDLRAERSVSNFDQRHQVTAQMEYTTGMGIKGGALIDRWKGTLLKGWIFRWQLNAGSGLPQTPLYNASLKGIGVIGNLRPDYTGASIQAAPAGLFLNPAAFTAPTTNHWGNAGRNSIRGPAQFGLNASLGRTFELNNRRSIDVRIDAMNVLNHISYKSWNTTINNIQFGLPSSAEKMRSMQITMRLRFDRGGI